MRASPRRAYSADSADSLPRSESSRKLKEQNERTSSRSTTTDSSAAATTVDAVDLKRVASRSLSPVRQPYIKDVEQRAITPLTTGRTRATRSRPKPKMRDFSEPGYSTRRGAASNGSNSGTSAGIGESMHELSGRGSHRRSSVQHNVGMGRPSNHGQQSLRDLGGGPNRLDVSSRHSSVSHLNYHARPNKQEGDDWSEGSDFDFDWRPPVSTSTLGGVGAGGLGLEQHFERSSAKSSSGGGRRDSLNKKISMDESGKSNHDSIASVDMTVLNDSLDLKNKIGDLKYKPVTKDSGIPLPPGFDRSASSKMFQRSTDQIVDQSVNLMGFESGSVGSGSGTMSSGGGTSSDKSSSDRRSISSSARTRNMLAAPSRPKRLSHPAPPPAPDQGSGYDINLFNMSLLDFMADPKGAVEQSNKLNAESEHTHQRSGSSARKSSRRNKNKRKTDKRDRWGLLPIVMVTVGTAIALIAAFVIAFNGRSGAAGAAKSGEDLKEDTQASHHHFKDGVIMLSSHNNLRFSSDHIGIHINNTDIIESPRSKKLAELQALIVQHGLSAKEAFQWGSRSSAGDIYKNLVALTPQTQALVWLTNSGIYHLLSTSRDLQHQKLFQRYALAVFYFSTHGHKQGIAIDIVSMSEIQNLSPAGQKKDEPSWIRDDGWLTSKSVCSWYGVGCDVDALDSEIVVSINLTKNGLAGKVPMQEMTYAFRWYLTQLDLNGNDITGQLTPSEHMSTGDDWFSWPRLTSLHLQDNRLSGLLPLHWLQESTELKEIDLSANQFNDTQLPDHGFENLSNLRTLRLDHNQLAGSVPDLGNLKSLEILDLQKNAFGGLFPNGVLKSTSLVELRLGNNQLTGTISAFELANMIHLEVLSLESNRLRGSIPDVFDTLPHMTRLSFGGNNFTGALPTSFTALEKLESLSIAGNALTGLPPAKLSRLTNLQSMMIHHNNFLGNMSHICTLKEGFFRLRLRHLAADCLTKVTCNCCDTCY